MCLFILTYGMSLSVAIAAVVAMVAMVTAIIFKCDSGQSDDYFPEI
jgi:hypothetical protein